MNIRIRATISIYYMTLIVLGFNLFCANLAFARSTVELELPLVINEAFTGNINTSIFTTIENGESESEVKIPLVRFKELAFEFASEEQFEQWFGPDAAEDSDATPVLISLTDLNLSGLEIEFDQGLLQINVDIPNVGIQEISVRGRRQPVPSQYFSQSSIASGLNVVLRNRINHKSTILEAGGFGDTSVDFSGFTSFGGFGGWSLFYEFDYDEGRTSESFRRRDILLTHDDFKRGLRYSLGDIRPTVSPFQLSPSILGFNVERDYSAINPFKNLRPSGRSTFTLDRLSTVSFEVNGAIINTVELVPGTYSIEDFPLVTGLNDVKVIIDDGTSRVEAANFSTYVDISLLAEKITNFGFTAGVLRDTDSDVDGIRYQNDPVLLGFYEKGLSRNLTVGANIELGQDHSLISTKAIFGLNEFGVIAFNGVISNRDDFGRGVNSLIQYNLQKQLRNGWFSQTDIQASFQSDNFLSIGELQSVGQESEFNARTSFSKNSINFTIGASLREVDDGLRQSLSATFSKGFRRFGLSLGYQYSKSDFDTDGADNRFSISISTQFGKSRAQARYNSNANEFSSEWRSRTSRDLGAINTRVSANASEFANDGELDLGYVNSRFELAARHRTISSKLADGVDSSGTNITASASFGYADGKFAFGRPFSSGFAIVDVHKNLRGKKVSISRNSREGQVVSTTRRLGTALIPVDSSYRTLRYAFSVDDLPIGYDIGEGEIQLFPGHLAGYEVMLGSDAANTVIGSLFWPDGTPLVLTSGKVISDSGTESIVFTNRTGRFVAEKLAYGSYQLRFGENDNEFSGQFEVAESPEPGLVRLQPITLQAIK